MVVPASITSATLSFDAKSRIMVCVSRAEDKFESLPDGLQRAFMINDRLLSLFEEGRKMVSFMAMSFARNWT